MITMEPLQHKTHSAEKSNSLSYSLKQGHYPAQSLIIQLWINLASTERAPPLARETRWVTIRDSLPLSTKYGQEEHSPFRKECREPSGTVHKYMCSTGEPHVFLLSHFTLTLQGKYHDDATKNVWHFSDQSSAWHFGQSGSYAWLPALFHPPPISLKFTGRPGHLPKVEPNICSTIKADIFIVDS